MRTKGKGKGKGKTPYSVNIYEAERGWGMKLDDVMYFQNPTAARTFVKEFNKDNNEDPVPDWYMFARYTGE